MALRRFSEDTPPSESNNVKMFIADDYDAMTPPTRDLDFERLIQEAVQGSAALRQAGERLGLKFWTIQLAGDDSASERISE